MKFVLMITALLMGQLVCAEGMPQNDQEFMRYMEAKAEQTQQEEEFKNPKTPEFNSNRPVLGTRNAKIKVIAYSDFQCPYCKQGYETVEELRKKYGDKMVFMFKHLPLPFHSMALPTAKRFEAIALHSGKKAYAFHNEIFKNQEGLSGGEAFLDAVVKKVGANVEQVKKDMESPQVKKNIESDQAEAKKYNISGTPGFVVAGVTLRGAYPIKSFEDIIAKRFGIIKN